MFFEGCFDKDSPETHHYTAVLKKRDLSILRFFYHKKYSNFYFFQGTISCNVRLFVSSSDVKQSRQLLHLLKNPPTSQCVIIFVFIKQIKIQQ